MSFIAYVIFAPAIESVYNNIFDESSITGENFLQSLKNENYDTAFSLFNEDVRLNFGSAENFAASIDAAQIDRWEYEASPGETTDGETVTILTGKLLLTTGTELDFQIIVQIIDGDHQIVGYGFAPTT